MTPPHDPVATRTAILDAAEQVFVEKGYGSAAMSEIARRAKVTKSLVHHHFSSKENLWLEVKTRRFRQYADAQLAVLRHADPDAELLRDSFQFYFRFLQSNPQMVKILAWAFLEQDRSESQCIAKLDEELWQLGTQRIREAQERGRLRADLDPHFILFTFVGIAQHWFQDRQHLLGHTGPDFDSKDADERYLRDAMTIFFDGVRPR